VTPDRGFKVISLQDAGVLQGGFEDAVTPVSEALSSQCCAMLQLRPVVARREPRKRSSSISSLAALKKENAQTG